MTQALTRRFWLPTLAAALALAATMSLGRWQLARAAQKEALHAAMQARQALPPLPASSIAPGQDIAPVLHRLVSLRGRWLPERTVYLDNRQMQGKPGFYVVTPFVLEDASAVAVQRGWVQRNFQQRDKLPAIDTPAGTMELRGRIAPPPAKLYEFTGSPGGAIRQNLDLGEFAAQTRLPLRTDLSVQQTGPASEGLLREWPEAGSGVEKHYGYAFQWFALSALITILYVWFQFVAPRRKSRRA